MSKFADAVDDVPGLDHLMLGSSDLDAGIAFVEKQTGIRAAMGGVHPGRGTRNALLSLRTRRYLEIIAPDPAQTNVQPFAVPLWNQLKSLKQPRLITWAAHVNHIEDFAKRINLPGEIHPGARKRPDGRQLSWKTLNLKDDWNGVLPFFIEWSADSIHPSVDAPAGCRLNQFKLVHPESSEVIPVFERLELAVKVDRAPQPGLHATISGPKGTLMLLG
jgi:hypothetical protein